jgi:putative ATPase
MSDLFSDAAEQRLPSVAPLAQRLRPRTLEEFVGQRHVLGERSALRLAIAEDRVPSLVLYGPPGSGKTTLARVVANVTGASFEELSAVSATVAQVREVLARARERLGTGLGRSILFLDEIHRFNKAQQDALLPAVEDGLVTLIGATTENPYFEVNSALLSRCQVVELEPHTDEDLALLVRRGAEEIGAEPADDLVTLIARRAGGDARNALNILELAHQTARAEGTELAAAHVEDAARKRPLVYDKGGDAHYDFTSAFIKSMRGSDPDAAVYYLAAMLEGGEDARFIARRMVILASEDIGNADPRALLVAVAAAQAVEHVGLPEARLNLAQAAIYLARAPKSNASYIALREATQDAREHGHVRPPDALRDTSYPGARRLGRGKGYVYPHDDPRGFETDHLPEPLKGRTYYRPSGSGEEVDRAGAGAEPSEVRPTSPHPPEGEDRG